MGPAVTRAISAEKPKALKTGRYNNPHPTSNAMTGWMKRHEKWLREQGFLKGGKLVVPPGTKLEFPETTVQACPKRHMSDFPEGFIPARYYESNLEHNQLIAHCCRHPENHMIEALKSHPEERLPDIYIFHCDCGRKHRWFMAGEYDPPGEHRPMWE